MVISNFQVQHIINMKIIKKTKIARNSHLEKSKNAFLEALKRFKYRKKIHRKIFNSEHKQSFKLPKVIEMIQRAPRI
jgi:hypothetical protein